MTIAAMETNDRTALDLLAFYRAPGVDALLGEAAIDRFGDDLPASLAPEKGASSSEAAGVGVSGLPTRAQDDPPPPLSRDGVPRTPTSPPPSAEAAVMSARAAAKSAESLDA